MKRAPILSILVPSSERRPVRLSSSLIPSRNAVTSLNVSIAVLRSPPSKLLRLSCKELIREERSLSADFLAFSSSARELSKLSICRCNAYTLPRLPISFHAEAPVYPFCQAYTLPLSACVVLEESYMTTNWPKSRGLPLLPTGAEASANIAA